MLTRLLTKLLTKMSNNPNIKGWMKTDFIT